ncbi:hypothetical protein NDU88_004149 [Pleurodeles waltl]|uniref:Uncharacterized protein n=1 Tax=Pleurodeles waltl TaxID=8319 RepID=A0AAV7MUN2_PLEWA|nr:hypothetical protein NDU88_004149 [Pleurodeles waltl]
MKPTEETLGTTRPTTCCGNADDINILVHYNIFSRQQRVVLADCVSEGAAPSLTASKEALTVRLCRPLFGPLERNGQGETGFYCSKPRQQLGQVCVITAAARGLIVGWTWGPEAELPCRSRHSRLIIAALPGQPEVGASGCMPERKDITGILRPLGIVVPSGQKCEIEYEKRETNEKVKKRGQVREGGEGGFFWGGGKKGKGKGEEKR